MIAPVHRLGPRIARARLEGDAAVRALVEALAQRLGLPVGRVLDLLAADQLPDERPPRPHDPTPLDPPDPRPGLIDPYLGAESWRPKRNPR